MAGREWPSERGEALGFSISNSVHTLNQIYLAKYSQECVDLRKTFHDIGFTWKDASSIYLGTLSGFCLDPSTVTSTLTSSSENHDENKMERDAEEA